MASFEVPLSGIPETFSLALNGTTYQLTVQWRANGLGGWILDIADVSGNAIISGIPLVTGTDLLAQHKHLSIAGGSALYVTDTTGGDETPTFNNLGSDTHLVLVTP